MNKLDAARRLDVEVAITLDSALLAVCSWKKDVVPEEKGWDAFRTNEARIRTLENNLLAARSALNCVIDALGEG